MSFTGVQAFTGNVATATNLSVHPSQATSIGNGAIVGAYAFYNSPPSPAPTLGITDSGGNTYTLIEQLRAENSAAGNTATVYVGLFYCSSIVASVPTADLVAVATGITATASRIVLSYREYSFGAFATGLVLDQNSDGSSGTSSVANPTSVITSSANELLVSVIGGNGLAQGAVTSMPYSVGAGWTVVGNYNPATSSGSAMTGTALAEQVVSATGTYGPSWSNSVTAIGSPHEASTLMATFTVRYAYTAAPASAPTPATTAVGAHGSPRSPVTAQIPATTAARAHAWVSGHSGTAQVVPVTSAAGVRGVPRSATASTAGSAGVSRIAGFLRVPTAGPTGSAGASRTAHMHIPAVTTSVAPSTSALGIRSVLRTGAAASTPAATSSTLRAVPRSPTAQPLPATTAKYKASYFRAGAAAPLSLMVALRVYQAKRTGSGGHAPSTTSSRVRTPPRSGTAVVQQTVAVNRLAKTTASPAPTVASVPLTLVTAKQSLFRLLTAAQAPGTTAAMKIGRAGTATTSPAASAARATHATRLLSVNVATLASATRKVAALRASATLLTTQSAVSGIRVVPRTGTNVGFVQTTAITLQQLVRNPNTAPLLATVVNVGLVRRASATGAFSISALGVRGAPRHVVVSVQALTSAVASTAYTRSPSTFVSPLLVGRRAFVYAHTASAASAPVATAARAWSKALNLSLQAGGSFAISHIQRVASINVSMNGQGTWTPSLYRIFAGQATWTIGHTLGATATMLLAGTMNAAGQGGMTPNLVAILVGQGALVIGHTFSAMGGYLLNGMAPLSIGHTFSALSNVNYTGASTWVVHFTPSVSADPIPSGLSGANRLLGATNRPILALLQATAAVDRQLNVTMSPYPHQDGDATMSIRLALHLLDKWTGIAGTRDNNGNDTGSIVRSTYPFAQQIVTMPFAFIEQSVYLEIPP